ncbi:CMRF35-like molecule 6 isoform X1 [Equus przewalskii]|uniref:CMRF35-like molecule 6 isoform X1 n=1 Tax=Equus przewalskii TaxID=9798 RepID=A0ABM4JJQ7_EQUPR
MGDMTVWLAPVLLLLFLPGSFDIRGPKVMRGPERGSLTVRCRYGPGWKTHRKWWCRGVDWARCKILVITTGSEQEVERDRVSIRDDQRNLTFTVTMEELRRDDEDTYWCGIERTGADPGFQVKVTIDPGPAQRPPWTRAQPHLPLRLYVSWRPWRYERSRLSAPPHGPAPGSSGQGSPQAPRLRATCRAAGVLAGRVVCNLVCMPSANYSVDHHRHVHSTSHPRRDPSLPNCDQPPLREQVPAQQRPLPAAALPGGAPAPDHAQCCPLGEQTSEKLLGDAESAGS